MKDVLPMKILKPSHWPRPSGYSNGIAATGRSIFVSGIIGWDDQCRLVSENFVDQVRQALKNIVAILAEANARPEHIVRMTWYVVDKRQYLDAAKEIGGVYREIIGRHFPAMTAVQVVSLMEDGALVEIEVTAVISE
jgi:enamine deaminase RidA (YjgF/YER057c/UK114 family)